MALTIILACVAALLVVSALALALNGNSLGRIAVYGGSLIVAAVGLTVALVQLLGPGPDEALPCPLGSPGSARIFALTRSRRFSSSSSISGLGCDGSLRRRATSG